MTFKLPNPDTFDKLFAQIDDRTIQKIEDNFWKNVEAERIRTINLYVNQIAHKKGEIFSSSSEDIPKDFVKPVIQDRHPSLRLLENYINRQPQKETYATVKQNSKNQEFTEKARRAA